ncbi:hypothetical protein WV31_04500 [Magnetospirillum sp. ME-1]|uniref:jacalin-like lectin n=1 Tax=Magnetospirillum sp. ME-1 TaxID=1639348 RepID=UPI000A17E6E8|nr:hypothetical protein [Magnetospirillum sp. ME-1]ARJ64978.1 hypothetical protein WV31_04500 [Magnetospirillum sp. ME-1]
MSGKSSGGSAPTALFQGYNSVLGNGLSTAVDGKSAPDGAKSEVRCSVSISIEELAQSLSIDQSLSVGFGPLGGIDEKVSFMTSLKVTTYSVSVTVYAKHVKGAESRTDVRFKSDIAIPQTDAQANQFVQYYGDSFVSRVVTGGEYMAVYTFYSQTKEEQTSLTTSLKANGIFDGVSVGGSLQTAMDNFLKTTKINYAFRQTVTGLLNPQLPLPASFIDYAVKFPSIPLDAPVVIAIGSAGYETVPGAGTGFSKVAANRTYFTGNTVVGGLTSSLSRIVQSNNQIVWLGTLYAYYGGFSDPTLLANGKTADGDIAAIQDQMNTFGSNPTASFPKLSLKALDNGTPAVVYEIHESGYWGGGGGGPFDDVDITTYIPRKTRIMSIGLRSGERTDQLRTTYMDDTGQQQTKSHGGTGGSDRGTLQLLPDQFVTRVWGRSGAKLDQLNIQISDGRVIGGGGGGGGGYSWTPPAGNFVLGFKGRCGAEVDGIQVVYANFKPAVWKH